jgi:hypothetical protein
MNVIDQILNEWSFRCHDGVVDINDPKKKAILDEILKEFNVNSLNEGQDEEDLTDIFKILGNAGEISKTKTFDILAQYTLDHYKDEPGMQDLIQVFPNYVNKVSGKTSSGSWKDYVPEEEKKDNRGKEVEVFLKNYAISKGVDSKLISGGRGKDVEIGRAIVESKSEKGNSINTQLQTTYYSSNVYYAFVNNTSGTEVEVRIVAGDLLRKLSFGEELNEKAANFEEILEKQIQKGLDTLPFAEMIKTALIQGPTKNTTSFFIGNKLKVRFLIFFEPAYGKERKKKDEEEELNENYHDEE